MSKTVIVTIHGIMTGDKTSWQPTFDWWLRIKHPNWYGNTLVHEPFSYGWLGPINSWLARILDFVSDTFKIKRVTRKIRVDRFKKFLIKVKEKYPSGEFHIIAHSFGTWITSEAIEELPKLPFVTVTYVGSILSSRLRRNKFDKRIEQGKVGTYNIWSSHNDKVVRFIALPPFGHLGYWGILTGNQQDRIKPLRQPYNNYRIFNTQTDYSHSEYFDDPDVFYAKVLFDVFQAEVIQ